VVSERQLVRSEASRLLQAALVARIARQGGQSIACYVAVAPALGYTITITEFPRFRVSRSGAIHETPAMPDLRGVRNSAVRTSTGLPV
jgi:uncharacterized protein YmfQ (DUF2313 family)